MDYIELLKKIVYDLNEIIAVAELEKYRRKSLFRLDDDSDVDKKSAFIRGEKDGKC